MKVAFVGKGGSGKTTLSSLFIRHLMSQKLPVVAIDADINQHLASALGLPDDAVIPALGDYLTLIKSYLMGNNPRIPSVDLMVKTTPPGQGSHLLSVLGDDPIHALGYELGRQAKLLVTGGFTDKDLGVACFHSKTGAVELYLNHLHDGEGEYVVVDMTAGADSFASGLFTRFDVLFLVAEPTKKGVSVYRQFRDYGNKYDLPLKVIGNKVESVEDRAFLEEAVGSDLLLTFGMSPSVRALEQGRVGLPLEREFVMGLERLKTTVDGCNKDWEAFRLAAIEFHVRNAQTWANRASGGLLETQIDPDFRFPGATAINA